MNSSAFSFDLLLNLVQRDFHLRYTGSALGVLWSLLLPLSQLLVLVFLFRRVIPLNIEAYPAFVFSALLPWTWFSTCLGGAGSLFLSNRDLIRRPNFEPAILIVVNTLSCLLTYLVSLPILFVLLFLYDREISLIICTFPILLLIQSILIIGLSLIIATLNVFYRDFQHIMGVVITILFYLTPVFYRPHQAGESYQILFTVNPMAVLIQSYRAIFLNAKAPAWDALLLTTITSIVVCGLGHLVYSREQHKVIDAI